MEECITNPAQRERFLSDFRQSHDSMIKKMNLEAKEKCAREILHYLRREELGDEIANKFSQELIDEDEARRKKELEMASKIKF